MTLFYGFTEKQNKEDGTMEVDKNIGIVILTSLRLGLSSVY